MITRVSKPVTNAAYGGTRDRQQLDTVGIHHRGRSSA